MKEEALKLADQLDGLNSCEPVIIKACETMIRRLVEELDKQFKNGFEAGKLEGWKAHKYHSTPQTKPLSDEEITFLWHKSMGLAMSDENLKNNISHASIFARAIEERHGIK